MGTVRTKPTDNQHPPARSSPPSIHPAHLHVPRQLFSVRPPLAFGCVPARQGPVPAGTCSQRGSYGMHGTHRTGPICSLNHSLTHSVTDLSRNKTRDCYDTIRTLLASPGAAEQSSECIEPIMVIVILTQFTHPRVHADREGGRQ